MLSFFTFCDQLLAVNCGLLLFDDSITDITSGSAMAEGPRDAFVSRNSATSYFLLTWLSGYFGRKVINKLLT